MHTHLQTILKGLWISGILFIDSLNYSIRSLLFHLVLTTLQTLQGDINSLQPLTDFVVWKECRIHCVYFVWGKGSVQR